MTVVVAGTGAYIPNPGFTPQVPSLTSALPYTNNQWNGATHDGVGNVWKLNGFTYTYDADNRQTQTVQVVGSNNITSTYSYDGEGRRVTRVTGGVTTVYAYDAMGELAAEYTDAVPPPPSPCPVPTCYLTVDHLGSTRVMTTSTGGVVARHDYVPFGEELFTTNRTAALGYAADTLPEKFTGKERDSETGLDFFGTRYMSAAQGRFTSPDKPLIGQDASDPQSWNLYSYVRNNPLRYTDPDGLDYHVCVTNSAGGQNCSDLNDAQYKKLYDQQNGKQGIGLPYGLPGGNITCGGQVCGSATYFETGIQDENVSIGIGIIGGKVAELALGKVFGWVAGLFGRTATPAATSAASDVLAGKVLTGFSAAQQAMVQKSLTALEAAGYNTGRMKTLIRIADAPSGYAGMSLHDGAALADQAFSSQAMLNHTLEHELIHMDQAAQGLRTAYGPGTAQGLEGAADAQAKFPAPQQ